MSDGRTPALRPGGPPEPFARGKRKAPEPGLGVRGLATEPMAPGRVLIIDEDARSAAEVAQLLGDDGHELHLAQRFDAGLALARATAPDVIIADPFGVGGPGEAMLDALRRVRDPAGNAPEVVLLTAHEQVEAAVSALHAGAADYVVKPADAVRVQLAVQRALDRRRSLNENERLRRDLSLFAAAQRILQVLEPDALLEHGLEALFTFSGADAGCILLDGHVRVERGLSPPELAALEGKALRSARGAARALDDSLAAFTDAMVLELGKGRAAVLVSRAGFSAGQQESALYLALELGNAFKISARYADAERAARRDSLTGLWNARTFQQAVERMVARAARDALPFSLLFIDVDHFKLVNDQHGHRVGSRVLQELAAELERLLREGDVIARYGGDEFTVLLPEVDGTAGLAVAERVRGSIAARPFLDAKAQPFHVTVCIGVAAFPGHADSAQGLLDSADRAMYTGKGASRNSVHLA